MDVSQAEPSAQLLNDDLAVVNVMIADGRHAEATADAEALAGLDLARVPAMARLGFAAALHAHAAPARRIVDNPPHNFEHIGLTEGLFPGVRILHMKRGPRDVTPSKYCVDYTVKFGGTAFADDSSWIGERLMDDWHSVLPGDILHVGDDALGGDAEGWARRMIDPLELPGEDGVLAFQRLERSVKSASV